ncbi:hypothetical protein ApAK_01475 [Thermoplasmatales archaeon AK]|nr:hypothetical protein [Thermoplasmatales archaeon AK]
MAVLFSIFVLVSYLNFPYSLLAAYNGHYVYGSLLILAVLIVSVYFSVKNIVEGIEVRPRLGRFQSSSSYRVSIHNFGRTPNLAVFSFNFKMISLGGQATGPVRSGRTSFSTRIQLKTALFIMVIMALIFGILDYLTSPQAGNSFIQGGLGSLALFYLVLFPISFFFSSTLLLERIWISSLAMPANTYFSLVIASKMVQAVILNIPFVAVSIVLSLVLHNLVIGYFITFLVLSPLYAASLIVFSTFTRPIQITDTLSPQGRVGARNFLLVVPTLVFIFGYFIAIIFPIYALAPAILLGAVVAYSIFSKGFWERIVNKLVERGYV